ncbi:MAG: Fe-S cluster assembly protein SufB [Candidatus Micrarchaeia archaeon]|jgi:Fe-S cluster assembly protein SufB
MEKEEYKYGFHDKEDYRFKSKKGISAQLIRDISKMKNEPEWMLNFRLKSFEQFMKMKMPRFGPDLSAIKFEDIIYYAKPTEKTESDWEKVPESIKKTFDKIGIPEAERKFLAGATAQYESEAVYHNLKKEWESQGVIFTDMDSALKQYPEIVKKYLGTLVPPTDNKFSALNSAVWSGGSFVYVPKGVKVEIPLQSYFRINTQNMGQFERTMIIVEEGASVSYVEGCSAPIYTSGSLHAAVVEVFAHKNSRIRYTTIQNWSNNVYNLVTKRAVANENATVEWIDGNIGSKLNMKYPCVILKEPGARADLLSVAYAGKGQIQDAGAKAIHLAPNTSSTIISKSISKDGGQATYRGLLKIAKGAVGSKATVRCDALILDEKSRSDTYPKIEVDENQVTLGHEAMVGRIGEEQLFYLMSRGISEKDALSMIVLGFIEPFTKELPMEYAVELNRLIQLEMEGSVG